MWLFIPLIILLMFLTEEKVKNKYLQFVLFLALCFAMAYILAYQPTWMEHLI
ncbi:hypothetical protein PHABIO_117 [Pseudomonas phage Phabio]|uniref:Uncharacterized protein n=1 Tax=Pseudomonas phage Phabio TaxID=2006668 RepID=A0A1Y0SZU6_9CAUD|nr:hypothetical protein MZD05_gp117 [Pseudomonas phage Phabio]ARV76748.1 hypothetical protein PHABIO_117 [Pseudomonas phage Phabio]